MTLIKYLHGDYKMTTLIGGTGRKSLVITAGFPVIVTSKQKSTPHTLTHSAHSTGPTDLKVYSSAMMHPTAHMSMGAE